MKHLFSRLIQEQDGQDVIEYVLIAAAISVIAIPVIPSIGTSVSTAWEDVKTKVGSVPGA